MTEQGELGEEKGAESQLFLKLQLFLVSSCCLFALRSPSLFIMAEMFVFLRVFFADADAFCNERNGWGGELELAGWRCSEG